MSVSSPAARRLVFTRRTFLTAAAAGSIAARYGIAEPALPRAAAYPEQRLPTDAPDIAARYRGMTPTRWGTALPGVATTFAPVGRQMALTFDACDRVCDDALLATLERTAVPALLFLSSRWIDANPGRAEQLAANPLFDIGNHGTRHVPLSVTGRSAYGIVGTHSAEEVIAEVWSNHTRIEALTGRAPTWFRPGTAYCDDVAVAIVAELGERPLGFSVAADNGAKASKAQVRSSIARAAPGSIVLAHMNHPESRTAAGVADAITAARNAGWEFTSVADHLVT